MDICPKSAHGDIPPHAGTLEDLPRMTSPADAVELLARKYRGRLVGVAYAVLGDRDLAEDAAQETLLRALQSWDATRPVGEALAWALVVCRNVSVDMARSRKLRKAEGLGTCPDWIEDRSRYSDPADEAGDREEWALVAGAFYDSLPMRSQSQFRALMHEMGGTGTRAPSGTHARDVANGIVVLRRRISRGVKSKFSRTLKSAV